MAQTFNTSISFVQSTSRKDRRKGAGSLSVSAFGSGVGNVADSATQAWVRNNFVDKTTEQEISAPKIFSQGIKIGDIAFYKHPDGYVYLDETLVLKGGVVMYGNGSGVEVPSIFDSLPIDDYTIKRDGNGALYVDETALSISGGGGGGGVADSVHWNNVTGKPSWIGSTKPSYKYSEIEEKPDLSVYAKLTDIPSLNGYATQNWVENKGYLLATTASDTYQPKITSSNKLAYSLISNTPDLSVYALNTDLAKKWTQNDSKIANWDSAYGWGNHANAGYAKASDVTNEFKNYVKLAGDSQSITAQHNFTNGLKIGGLSLRKVDDYLYLDSSLVLSGGVTMYGDDGTTVKPIWESIPFDRTTIDWVDGKWTVVGGVGSGGGISEEFLNVTLQGYQPKITSSNKLAYSLISGTPDLSVYFLASNFTKANIKSTLGISDWALASAKPTYTASEVGALGVNDTAINANKLGGYLPTTYMRASGQYTDSLNDLTSLGIYRMSGTIKDGPTGAGGYGNLMVVRSNSWDSLSQLYFNANNNRIFVRSGTNSNFTSKDWSTLAFTSDIPTKLSQLTDDVVAGKYLSLSGGTMTGSITTRSNVYSWANAKTVGHIIAGHNVGESAAPIISTALASGGYGKLAQVSDQFGLYAYSASDSTPSVRFALYPEDGAIKIMGNTIPVSTTTYNLGSTSAKWSNVYATSFIGNLTGNADSATDASNLTQTTYTGDVNADDLYGSKSRVLKLSTNANLPVGMNYGNILYIGGGDTGFMLAGSYSRDKLLFRRGTNKNNAAQNIHTNSWKEIAFTDSNVASATKLATARTIWGQSFDGTVDITGDLTIPNNNSIKVKSSGGVVYSVLKMSTANSLSIGQESASNGRTTMIYGNLIRLRCGTGGTDAMYINASGNVTIGASDLAGATNKMYVDGDVTFSSKVVIGTIPVYQSADGTLFVDANVVFTGGVAMYGNTTTTINEE